MTEKKFTWHKLAESMEELSLPVSGLEEREVAGKRFCLILSKEQLYACAAKCPHAGGTMAEGYVDALGNIVCPVHRYKFSVEKGRNTSGEGYFLKTYPVEKREDGIYIGFETGGFLDWLK